MEKILSAEGLIKRYGAGQEKRNVLDGVSIDMGKGEYVSVMGPSGSGKSTLLYALSGMDAVDGGRRFFAGRNLAEMKEKELADIRRLEMGFVFQQPSLLKNLNVLDNIIVTSGPSGKKERKCSVKKAEKLMEKTGIAQLGQRDVAEVSGGQLQRAGICRALMNEPKVIFADEPTGALNSSVAQDIMDIFSEINRNGTAILLVTHDARVAAQTERIMFMSDGKIVDQLSLPGYNGEELDSRIDRVMERMRRLNI